MASGASSADVVVVGGGIIGCASAYHLARRGVRVLLLDKGRIATSSPAGTWARSATSPKVYSAAEIGLPT